MAKKQLAILGGGFMGSAIAAGLIESGWRREDLIVAEVREARREFLTQQLQLETTEDSPAAIASAEVVLIAVKPQAIEPALMEVAAGHQNDQLLLSVCAGITTTTIEARVEGAHVIRAMPNTAAAIGTSATAIARGTYASDSDLATAINILSAVGKVVVVDEAQIDAVTAVSGTGPAYVFFLAEALIEAAQREGLSREQAHVLTYQTLLGSARLLSHDTAGPAELRARVTSPGGTTDAAIRHLESAGWQEVFIEAVGQARKRAGELGRNE